MESILNRRSIRKFTPEPVTNDQITQLLKAAMAAPSAQNQQPWQFVVIDDREILSKIPEFHPYSKMLFKAPVAILVCADKEKIQRDMLWPQDCSAATQNILVAITSLGLGGVWLGVYPIDIRMDGLTKLLNLPEKIIPFSLIALGHPDEIKPPSNRCDESRIHHNIWGNSFNGFAT
ncbi:MAG: nitroreductase family protein [bacterium]